MAVRQTPSLPAYDEVDWSRALCRTGGYDPDLWFDDTTAEVAAAICQSGTNGLPCPIREQCLQYAFATSQRNGVWGGLTEEQRKIAGWAKHRVKCPSCRSTRVEAHEGKETCLACALSWRV